MDVRKGDYRQHWFLSLSFSLRIKCKHEGLLQSIDESSDLWSAGGLSEVWVFVKALSLFNSRLGCFDEKNKTITNDC